MATPLLATKLYVPKPRPELVLRPQLIERLNEGLHHKLTVISAPAGFGKTTLVNEWVTTSDRQVAWLSLDESDGDLTVFLNYFIAALNQAERSSEDIGEGALSMLQSPQPPAVTEILTGLINELAAIPTQTILVLDDYHRIQAQPIHDALTFLLEHLPEQLHLVIVTRQDPQIPLAKLRAQDQLTELRASDLRFSTSEAAEFLDQVMGLKLSPDDVALLESRTEGWIAGLQLAAISMQGIEDTAGFIESFTGSHHFVLDYLIEEVLNNQTEEVQTFLLQTSILDRMTGALCDAITGQHDGQATLEILEHANLFIIPLDEERKWYRYHHLFADLLRIRLRRSQPEHVANLLASTSTWYENEGFLDEAIEYALRAEDFERAIDLINGVAEATWLRGEDTKLCRWLDKLPKEIIPTKPQLCVFYSWSLFATGQQEAAMQILQAAEKSIQKPSGEDNKKLKGRIAAVRAYFAFYSGEVAEMMNCSQQALEDLPEQDLAWRIIATNVRVDAMEFAGDSMAVHEARREALKVSQASDNRYQIIISRLKLAITLRTQGRLSEVVEICQQEMQHAHDNGLSRSVIAGFLLGIWSEALVELNYMDEANQRANEAADLIEHGGDRAMVGWAYVCLTRVLFSSGQLDEAEKMIQKVERIAQDDMIPPWMLSTLATWKARVWLAKGELKAVSEWVHEHGLTPDDDLSYWLELQHMILARLLIAQGRAEESRGLLDRLLIATEAGKRTARRIELLELQAMALHHLGNEDQAMDSLRQALDLAKPRGFVRVFVNEGPAMAQLLYEAVRREISTDYAQRLLAAFPISEPEPVTTKQTKSAGLDLIEPLSARESEVLELMAEGLTNQEIGSKLFLSLNTVKVHARNIYGKLGVNNRTQAVTKAQGLGILQQR
ncbi:MAG: hypothetical protein DWQ07_11135 [Chloroflexi bacterium]|nr:MAG: hypothetical protein DWQ07_11135 [Chloroflexota bacterium]